MCFSLILSYAILLLDFAYSGGVNFCWNPSFYFVVLNQFCHSLLKIDGLFYFVKSGNTKIISSENKVTLTKHSLVLNSSQDH